MTVRWVAIADPGAPVAAIRIAVVDSGIAAGHPHVGAVASGVAIVGDDPADTADRLGHGTAVAAAIREKAPWAELVPVRVLEQQLVTTARILATAITRAVEDGARLVNLSLGTTNPAHLPLFESAIAAAVERGAIVVSALGESGTRLFPGSLTGAIGVAADPACDRFRVGVRADSSGTALVASPLPRPIPGVDPTRNLSGVSFAVANATGLLARLLAARPELRSAREVLEAL